MKPKVDREPLRFYFLHRDRIEEWAALRNEADAYAKGLLVEAADEWPVPEGAALYHDDDNAYQGAVMHRREWADAAGRPHAGVGFGWGNRPNIRRPDTTNGPWWGVWHGQTNREDTLPTALRAGLSAAAEPLGLKPRGTWAWWPLWTVVPPAEANWYDDLNDWAEKKLYQTLGHAWEALADPIELVLNVALRR